MTEKSAPYLHLIRKAPSDDASDASDGVDETEEAGASAGAVDDAAPSSMAPSPADGSADAPEASLNEPLQQAIMHAAVSWVALIVERPVYAVDIQPIARRRYEVSVHYSDPETGGEAAGEGIILRIALAVEPGLALRTSIEPVRP